MRPLYMPPTKINGTFILIDRRVTNYKHARAHTRGVVSWHR